MTDNKIGLKKIVDLLGDKFFIPSYQRGYRWKKQQVNDLLDDIWEFYKKGRPGFYCLQPLTVTPKEIKKEDFDQALEKRYRQGELKYRDALLNVITDLTVWEVIDGQQRLTTIYLILSFLQKKTPFVVSYETRSQSEEFLKTINPNLDHNEVNSNIDFFHIVEAYNTIECWFSKLPQEEKSIFQETLLEYVQVIWYEVYDEVPTKVFTRLNIGKIALTNAELIKALLLNCSNWQNANDKATVELIQMEIASQWDSIEYTLQNKEFWMFIHSGDYEKNTRIELVFEYICKYDILKCEELYRKYCPEKFKENKNTYDDELGDDKYKTFRYFNLYFEMKKKESSKELWEEVIKTAWEEVEKTFNTLLEWYNDCVLFHYIGFLIETNGKNEFYDLLNEWNSENSTSKDAYETNLKKRIKNCIKNYSCLSKQCEINGNLHKKFCKPLLLLFNIQSVINQNKSYSDNELYQAGVFYKFPFHLYKSEAWDIEHIDSNTTNTLTTLKDQKEWVLNALFAIQAEKGEIKIDDTIKQDIITLLQGNEPNDFKQIQEELNSAIKHDQDLTPEEKNQIGNFALLDRGTNRGYHNDMFPTKRRKMIAKDQGASVSVVWELNEENNLVIKTEQKENAIAFVPPCTKNAFLKYYTPGKNDSWSWSKTDANNYKQAIFDTLKDFGVILKEDCNNEQ
ncbi:MAG: DUF262 domain-containing protein [Lentisphaerae bacterium]|nr:DUF262 domain-containing protein [Lentisphaerota bacterium]